MEQKAAVFLARKIFCDFVHVAKEKIEAIVSQDDNLNNNINKNKSLFKTFLRNEDLIYDQTLEALGAISEYCLPSILKLLISWYHYQLDEDDSTQKRPASVCDNLTFPILDIHQQQQQQSDCGSPIDDGSLILGQSLIFSSANPTTALNLYRSPTPSSPDLMNNNNNNNIVSKSGSNQNLNVTSPQSLQTFGTNSDCPSPSSSLTTAIVSNGEQSLTTSNSLLSTPGTANTSTSTATNVSSNSLTENDNNITATNQSSPPQQQQQNQSQQKQDQLQPPATTTQLSQPQTTPTTSARRLESFKTRNLLIEYVLCQALIEIFGHLNLHPGYQDLIAQIEDISFERFKYVELPPSLFSSSDVNNIQQLIDKYAQVIGVLAQTRFKSVRKRFTLELNELRNKEPTNYNIQCIVTLLSGMKYFRVKMAPIEEFEASMQFMQECADYFIETRHKSIKHALANLLVEIMVPLAAKVKNEVKIPCLKNFVDSLWPLTLDMCNRKKHSIILFPLVTCLLCVSQRAFFLFNWSGFLNMCLANLKNRDPKMCRVALDSLYRLVWIYMIRIKCESNNVTQTKLQTIVDALFPRNSRSMVPRDAPLTIFVDIIHFVAQERLDFAMRNIIFDLLSVDRSYKLILAPERMNVGLQSFMLIAYSLQQKDSEPAMPIGIGDLSNGCSSPLHESMQSLIQRSGNNGHNGNGAKRLYSNQSNSGSSNFKTLNEEAAKAIGLNAYLPSVRKSLNDILRSLDGQFGKSMLLTGSNTTSNRDHESEAISADRRPKIELFRTCLACIPRLMPEGLSKVELIELLSRMTVHVDEEMRKYAFESLLTLVSEFPDWRLDVIEGFAIFLTNHIDESMRLLVDNSLKMLLRLVLTWRQIIAPNSSTSGSNYRQQQQQNQSQGVASATATAPATQSQQTGLLSATLSSRVSIQTGYESLSSRSASGIVSQVAARKNRALAEMRLIQGELNSIPFDRLVNVIQRVEGASLVMTCSCHQLTRRLASRLLRECRSIIECYASWIRMDQFGLRPGDEGAELDDDYSALSLRGSLSADNLSRITTISGGGGPTLSGTGTTTTNNPTTTNNSVNSLGLMSTSASKMCLSSQQLNSCGSKPSGDQSGSKTLTATHDAYDSCDIEDQLVDCFGDDSDNVEFMFWLSLTLLESDREQEFSFGLKLLKTSMPKLPFECLDFVARLEARLLQMGWLDYPGLHKLVLNGCLSDRCKAQTLDMSVAVLDYLTPLLKHPICCGLLANGQGATTSTCADDPAGLFPTHVIVLMSELLANYEDPSALSMNIARRIAIWCEQASSMGRQLDNLAAVMSLYSRRSFSKDAFQWTKCVIKYLHDAYGNELAKLVPILVSLHDYGPDKTRVLVAPLLYCLLSYVDMSQSNVELNEQLTRLYSNYLATDQWREALQVFKLVISRSSTLVSGSLSTGDKRELPGRTLEFELDIESLPLIAI